MATRMIAKRAGTFSNKPYWTQSGAKARPQAHSRAAIGTASFIRRSETYGDTDDRETGGNVLQQTLLDAERRQGSTASSQPSCDRNSLFHKTERDVWRHG